MRAEKMIHLDSLAYSYVPFQKIGLRHQKRYPCMIVLDAIRSLSNRSVSLSAGIGRVDLFDQRIKSHVGENN